MKKTPEQKRRQKMSILNALKNAGIQCRTENKNHYFIDTNEERIDFWPTTGKFWVVGTKIKGFGVKDLIYEVSVRGQSKKPSLAKPSFKPTSDARHRQRRIMAHFGMNFD